jgi:hypothetical protein
MADWETNDSGGMDEEQAIKKMIKIVESFNKTMKGGIDLTEKSQVQLMKSILSHQKAYKTDKDHQMWKEQSIEQTKKAHIAVFAERQKELRLSKLINKSLSTQVNTYDKVFKTLGGTTGFGNALLLMTGRLNEMRRTTEMITKQQKIVAKEFLKGAGGDSGVIKSSIESIDVGKKSLEKLTFNNETLKKVAKRLEKLGEFMEKHQGKLIIGAAAISILTGIIAKALNVAPLFQAMMKLMQFAFTMVLMPIGTFFGAVIKPIVIGLVKKLAPEFGKWMEQSMAIGNALGMFLTSLDTTFFDNLGNAIKNLAKITGATDFITDPENGAVVGAGAAAIGIGGVVAATVLTKKVFGKLGGSAAEVVGKSGSKTATALLKSVGLQAKILAKLQPVLGTLSKTMPKLGVKLADAMVPKIASMIIPMQNIATKVAAKSAVKLGLKAIPIVGWATLIGDALGSVMKEYAPEQYEGTRQAAFGVGSALGDTEGEWTEKILDVFGFGSMSTWEQIQEGFASLEETFAGDGIKDIENSLVVTGSMAEMFEEVVTKMGTENAPVMDMQMNLIMNMFINMKKMGATANEAAIRTADNFSLADKTIQAKLSTWIRNVSSGENPNRAAIREATNARNAYANGQSDADNFFGGGKYINPWTKSASTTTSLQDKLDAEAKRAAKNYAGYDSIYGGANGQGNNSYNDTPNAIQMQVQLEHSAADNEMHRIIHQVCQCYQQEE